MRGGQQSHVAVADAGRFTARASRPVTCAGVPAAGHLRSGLRGS